MNCEEEMVTVNPLQSGDEHELYRRKRTPSKAYMASLRRAQESNTYCPPDSDDTDKRPGWKTIASSVFLLIAGFVIFVTGAVFYWTSTGKEKHAQGKDMLILGGILLLPGSFANYIFFGTWMRWKGFRYSQVPSLYYDEVE